MVWPAARGAVSTTSRVTSGLRSWPTISRSSSACAQADAVPRRSTKQQLAIVRLFACAVRYRNIVRTIECELTIENIPTYYPPTLRTLDAKLPEHFRKTLVYGRKLVIAVG